MRTLSLPYQINTGCYFFDDNFRFASVEFSEFFLCLNQLSIEVGYVIKAPYKYWMKINKCIKCILHIIRHHYVNKIHL